MLIGLLPMGDGECTLFCSASPAELSSVRTGGYDRWREGVLRLCPLSAEVLDSAAGPEELRFTDYRHTWMRSLFDERVVFLGDAAHAMSPHLGQGVNLALLDAEALADAIETAPNLEDAFRRYAILRRSHVRYYSWLTFALTPFFQSNSAILGLGRDIGLPILGRVPFVRRRMAQSMAGISIGLFARPIDVSGLVTPDGPAEATVPAY